ncbi:MAG: hypothetical protein IRY87_33610 [Acetobacteraceae bacterium]|nr:hypothetical protein [Acetobacteraceae bacterium]
MRILRKLLLASAVGLTGLALAPTVGHADPHWRGGWHHRHHHHHHHWRPVPRAFYVPPPVYYAPRPYYYAPPAYYVPPPRYYAPGVTLGITIP